MTHIKMNLQSDTCRIHPACWKYSSLDNIYESWNDKTVYKKGRGITMARLLLVFLAFTIICVSGCSTLTGRTAGEIVDDSTITTTINAEIIKDSDLHYLKINVDSFSGNVTLTGVVPDKESEKRIMEISRKVKGVKSVKSNLSIEEKQR